MMVKNCGVLILSLFLGNAFAMDDAAILEQGRKLFQTDADPACAICHTLADAGTKGKVGPVLDELKPSEERVLNALKNGKGGMPPFVDHLTVDQMKILAKYVSTVTGGNKP
ncbi:cytochrome c [Limnobacter sp.]|uniref:SorU family sulfite dehydrogenase c-type cytochrome subunit n=1 Tax=Limnobacter sp. TaxID=2003368 RepID=UPI0027369DCC|nr:cytochrome c [Limnobacter sp.]MDP3188283.1 cytochrome c [Limnobacter sp.]